MSDYDAPTIASLSTALRNGGSALENVPELLRKVLGNGAWRDFTTIRGERVTHTSFVDFVEARPLKGLGSTLDVVQHMAGSDHQLLDLLDQALQGAHGGERSSPPSKSDNITLARDPNVRGTSAIGALRRLRDQRPDLHAQVLANELSPHKAMLEAGFRRRRLSVSVEDPSSTAESLRKHLTPEQRAELVRLLSDEDQ